MSMPSLIILFWAAVPKLLWATKLANPTDGECLGAEACGEDAVERMQDGLLANTKTELLQKVFGLHKAHDTPETLDFHSSVWPCEGIECVKKYVDLPDSHYSWQDTGNRLSGVDPSTAVSWTGYVLNMTSQKWLTKQQVDFPIQWHTIVVVVPENLQLGDWANLIIDFGVNLRIDGGNQLIMNRQDNKRYSLPPKEGSPPFPLNSQTYEEFETELTKASSKAAYLATHTQSVAIALYCALNAVQGFKDDPLHLPRVEDLIKGYSWVEFIKNGADEPERIMELAVAKAVVRALDTATAFTEGLPSGKVTRFGVTGYSKYGMATWMAGAIDERVKAIAPEALPASHWNTESVSLLEAYNSPLGPEAMEAMKVSPYAELDALATTHLEESMRLQQIIDVGSWLDQVKVPVFYAHDTNDVWFPEVIGDVGTWLPMLGGPTRCLFVNATHDGVALAALSGVAAFFRGHILGEEIPEISYELNRTSRMLTVTQISAHKPISVRLYNAISCEGEPNTPVFEKTPWSQAPTDLKELQANGTWVADLGVVAAGGPSSSNCFLGAFVRLEYPGPVPGYDAYQISTPAVVLPQST